MKKSKTKIRRKPGRPPGSKNNKSTQPQPTLPPQQNTTYDREQAMMHSFLQLLQGFTVAHRARNSEIISILEFTKILLIRKVQEPQNEAPRKS